MVLNLEYNGLCVYHGVCTHTCDECTLEYYSWAAVVLVPRYEYQDHGCSIY
jgi:hypothetical protein